jgi:hypothetical protein
MKEKPIICTTELVKAIFENTKTVTRRVTVPQPPEYVGYFVPYGGEPWAYTPGNCLFI